MSKLGYCSRSQAWELCRAGRVRVNGKVVRDPEFRVHPERDRLEVDQQSLERERSVYLMLNKPRGLVTTASDEKGRPTVFDCLRGHDLPFVSPVGRLDQASEGLLLFTNDTAWANAITDPASKQVKRYHVQINAIPSPESLRAMEVGIDCDGERLSASKVLLLRQGEKNSWLEINLCEGKNRQIRRLLAAFDVEVLRLIRIAIGSLELGSLAKGSFRTLTPAEAISLAPSILRKDGRAGGNTSR